MTYSEIHTTPSTKELLELRTESYPSIQRYAVYGGRRYSPEDFLNLLTNVDGLKGAPDLLSRIVCHLFLKATYEFIQSSQHFQNKPLSQNLLNSDLSDKNRLAKAIKEPSVSGAVLNFFVSQIGTGVPYEVHCNLIDGKISLRNSPELNF